MAERNVTVCDIDERQGLVVPAVAHVRLDIDGEVQQYDLCQQHMDELRGAVAALIPGTTSAVAGQRPRRRGEAPVASQGAAARDQRRARAQREGASAAGTRRAAPQRKPDTSLGLSDQVRCWAREQGLDVKDRGRIPKAVVEQYAAAQRESGSA